MAWEWVAPVSAAGGGAIGAVTTWLAGRSARRDAAVLDLSKRRQQQLADAYIELLEMLHHVGQWVLSIHRTYDEGQPKHPLPSAEQQVRVRALVDGFGSPVVKDLFADYDTLIHEIMSADRQITAATPDHDIGRNTRQPRHEFGLRLRPDEQELRAKITEQVAAELQGK